MSSPVRATQAKLVACHVAATQFEARLSDGVEPNALWRCVRDVRDLVRETAAVLSELVEEREQEPRPAEREQRRVPSGEFSLMLDAPNDAQSDPAGDIAFVARAHLQRRVERYENYSEASPASVLTSAAGSGIRHVIKATCAVESVYAESYGLVPRLDPRTFLERSLAVRRAYTAFRMALKGIDTQGCLAGIERARLAIQDIVIGPSFRNTRWSDRSEFLALSLRLGAWLSESNDSEEAGRLLGDVCGFAAVLADINRREELLQHDIRLLPRVIDQLEALSETGRPVLRGHLEQVRGIDDGIEELLATGITFDAQTLITELRRVLSERARCAGLPIERAAR